MIVKIVAEAGDLARFEAIACEKGFARLHGVLAATIYGEPEVRDTLIALFQADLSRRQLQVEVQQLFSPQIFSFVGGVTAVSNAVELLLMDESLSQRGVNVCN